MAGKTPSSKKAKTILVTGGAGFIGSNFIHHIYRKYPDYKIVVVDALTYAGSLDNLPSLPDGASSDRLQFWYGNICNANLMDAVVAQCDTIVHFAAETHVTRSIYDNRQFFETDVMGTYTIMNAALKHSARIERIVHVSTSEVYGTAERPLIDEEHPLKPMSPYASAKCGADRLVYSYWTTYGLPATIVRPFNNYGPRQHLEKVVPRFITSAILGEELTVHGDGGAARDFIHCDDTANAIDLVLHAPLDKVAGEVFNAATGQHRAIADIARDVTRLMGGDPGKIVNIDDRPGQVVRHTGDWSKIKRVLGWEPKVDWETGLRGTVEWYKANREWWAKQTWMRRVAIRTVSGKIEMH